MSIFRNRHRYVRSAVLLALAFHTASPLRAIDPERAISQYIRDRWGPEQGLPRSSIFAIEQTEDGYLWVGTGAGLFRFDGVRFIDIHDPSDNTALSVLGLKADGDGSLWIRLRDMSLLHYRNGAFERQADHDAWPFFTAFATGNRAGILAATMGVRAYSSIGGVLQLIASANTLPRVPILSVARTPDGAIWMGSRGGGLFRLRPGKADVVTAGLPNKKVNCLLTDRAGDLWIGTDHGIARWNGRQVEPVAAPANLKTQQILGIVQDRDSNLWIGSDSGTLTRMDSAGRFAQLDNAAGPHAAVTALLEDREGSIWIGGNNGLQRLRDSAFVTYSSPEGLPTDGSNPVYVDPTGRTWFSPSEGGLRWFDGSRSGNIAIAGLDRDVVYSIAGAGTELWLGRQRGGVTHLASLPNGSFRVQTFTTSNGLAQNSVYSLYRAHDGAVWAGTLSGGVTRIAEGRFTTFTTSAGLASNTVASILQTPDATLWFATPNGLSALEQERWHTYDARAGLPSSNINCLFYDSAGLLWAGTAGGLAVRRNGRFQVPPNLPSALREQVLGIVDDNFQSLWLATSNHVVRVNRQALLAGTLADGGLREFGLADGLRGMEGVKRHQSVTKDAKGRIWISLNNGISVADPARLRDTATQAIAHVQALSADGVPIPLNGSIRIPERSRRVVFSYVGLSFSTPERFRYKLESFDRAWSQPVADREAVYTNLGPGPYRFLLQAANADGSWSTNQAQLPLQVNPAYWQSWYFRAAALFIGLVAIVVLYRLRLQHLTNRLSLRFEERLAERTRIAQELHDTLLQGFLSASMQVHVASDMLPGDAKARPLLERSLQLMHQVIDEGRNTVRGLRSANTASISLEAALARVPEELWTGGASTDEPAFEASVTGQTRALHPVLRDEVFRICREALVNAFRHSGASRIELKVDYSTTALRVKITDNGCGIAPEFLRTGRERHWGLSGMRERAQRIGARLKLGNRDPHGTEVDLSVPGHIAYIARRNWLRFWSSYPK